MGDGAGRRTAYSRSRDLSVSSYELQACRHHCLTGRSPGPRKATWQKSRPAERPSAAGSRIKPG